MKVSFHWYGWRMDLQLKSVPFEEFDYWSVTFIRSFSLLNWTPSQRGVEIGSSLSMQGYRYCPRANHISLNQIKCKLHTGSYAPLAITISCLWDSNRTTQS